MQQQGEGQRLTQVETVCGRINVRSKDRFFRGLRKAFLSAERKPDE